MKTFILIHGSFHGAWNWHKVVPLIEAGGHRAITMDMPGHNLDHTAPHRAGLEAHVASVIAEVNKHEGQVVLVAHSRNGIVISQVAERIPEKVERLIYIAAYLVPNGKCMMEYTLLDQNSLVFQNAEPKPSRAEIRMVIKLFRNRWAQALLPWLMPGVKQAHSLKREVYHEALYHDCPEEITSLAEALLGPEPNWSGFVPLQLSAGRYGRIPKSYIRCSEDRAVTPALQDRMLRDTPCDSVVTMHSSHSPFFSQPKKLVNILFREVNVVVLDRAAVS